MGEPFKNHFSSYNKKNPSFVSYITKRVLFYLLSCFLLFFLIRAFDEYSFFSTVKDFFPFLGHFFSGHWGNSSIYQKPIDAFILPYFIFSCSLGLASLFGAFFLGLFLALYTLSIPFLASFLKIILLGTPITIWALILNYLFTGGIKAPTNLTEHYTLGQFLLPWVIVTFYHSCAILQMSQFFFYTESQKPYYSLLTKISGKKIFPKYLLKSHIPSILHNLSLKVCILLGGSVGVENFFHIPGLGFMLRKSIIEKDTSLLLTSSFLILSFITIVYILLDLLKKTLHQKVREVL